MACNRYCENYQSLDLDENYCYCQFLDWDNNDDLKKYFKSQKDCPNFELDIKYAKKQLDYQYLKN